MNTFVAEPMKTRICMNRSDSLSKADRAVGCIIFGHFYYNSLGFITLFLNRMCKFRNGDSSKKAPK
jgi:hypothetical protein